MSIGSAVLLGLVVLTLVYGVVIYNGLVQLKHNLAKAWANIDVLLKQRHDELPSWSRCAASTSSSSRTRSRA